MNYINQTKVQLIIGIIIILIPLSGFPRGFKTFVLVTSGAFLVYTAVHAVQKGKEKIKKARRISHQREKTFVEHKPLNDFSEIESFVTNSKINNDEK